MKTLRSSFSVGAALLYAAALAAGTWTQVDLVRQDERLPRLGLPAVLVVVEAGDYRDAARLASFVSSDLDYLAHVSLVTGELPFDYELRIRVEPPRPDSAASKIAFGATLSLPDGTRAWEVVGETRLGGTLIDDAVLRSIGRNVASELIRYGWLPPRDHPENPPPAAPGIRRDR